MIIDEYYTPKILAEKLVNLISSRKLKSIVDFCVGDGELLRAANTRWPKAKLYGTDISLRAIERTSQKHPDWELSVVDFLDSVSREETNVIRRGRVFDLILLNPPFSCIGAKINSIFFKGNNFQVSTAMKFIAEAMNYLKTDGVLYAILPASVAYSQKDKVFWNFLIKNFNLTILEETSVKYFYGCVPNIIIVSINDFQQKQKKNQIDKCNIFLDHVEIFRGKISMNAIPNTKGDYYFIHTTNLRNNKLENLSIKLNHRLSTISGPAILIPRVGNPNPNKICIINKDETYILSDCIIAIKVATKSDGVLLFSYFLENWEKIKALYKGTGAKYITVEKISLFLNLDYQKKESTSEHLNHIDAHRQSEAISNIDTYLTEFLYS